ncbi:MAG: hypothetical protein HQL16_02820 [Candidatus Omnitrophica bacterium]|nr:hypothetical protein [Candidatus Omnitrophota bacterium]
MMLALGLLMVGVLARFLPHAPNFTPVIAIALFGSVYLKRSQAILLPLILMMVTDLFLGLYPSVMLTWAAIFCVSAIGLWVRQNKNVHRSLTGALWSAILFFIVSNFGCWLTDYPHTWAGFVSCYTLAVPFFRMTLVSTLLYAVLLFGGYEFLAQRVKATKLAEVLLK